MSATWGGGGIRLVQIRPVAKGAGELSPVDEAGILTERV